MKMRMQSLCCGGRELACQTIERTYIVGDSHLVDRETADKVAKMSLCTTLCAGSLFVVV